MLITWSWFLQNSSARSYFKGSLIPPLWSYIMLQTLKNQRTKCSWIQFHVFTCNQNGFRLLKWLKETRFYKRKKKIITKNELCIQLRKLVERRSLHNVLRNEKVMFQKKKEIEKRKEKDVFFSTEHSLLVAKEPLFWIFRGWKMRPFLSQKVDENMILITEKFPWEWEIRSFFETKI